MPFKPTSPTSQRARAFWDDVFIKDKTAWVADHPPEHFFGVLGLVGPFEAEFRRARSVLDVGPGRGRLIAATPRGTRRFAVEISRANASVLWGLDVDVAYPGISWLDDQDVELAWSVSCFPHCDPEMQDKLLRQVYRALRPGGSFYLEHVMRKSGAPDCQEDLKLPAGRYCALPSELPWPGSAMRWIDRDVGGDDCPVRGWVALCRK